MAIQASKANEAIQTILDQNVNHMIPPYNNHYRKYGIDILIQGKMNHILIKVRKFRKDIVVYERKLKMPIISALVFI